MLAEAPQRVDKSIQVCLLAASILRSIELCDVDIRKDLYGGIVATGAHDDLITLRMTSCNKPWQPTERCLQYLTTFLRHIADLQFYLWGCFRICEKLQLTGQGHTPAGGTSLFPQLRDRLEKELTEAAPQAVKVKVMLPVNTTERRYSVWIGACF